MTRIYSTVCDASCESFAFKCPETALVEQLDNHGLPLTSLNKSGCKAVEAQRYALFSHIMHGFCSEGRRPTCDRFVSFCLTVPTSPSILSTSLLHFSASSKGFPLQILKTLYSRTFLIGCPSNHQRKSLLRQLRIYLEKMSYLPVGIMEQCFKRPSSYVVVTLNTAESMWKPQLQRVADAHGLQAETSQTVESFWNSITLHISSGHCGTNFFSSNGPPDLLPLERRLLRACLDIWLDFKRHP